MARPTEVSRLTGRVVDSVSCGRFHSAAVIAGSPCELRTWGRGTLGLLGHGDEEDCLEPRSVEALRGIPLCAVACGLYQTAAAAAAGHLYFWGWRLETTEGGELIEGYATVPQRVGSLGAVRVRAVSCGHYCAAAMSRDGALSAGLKWRETSAKRTPPHCPPLPS